MKCPECATETSVLETRETASGYIMTRTRICFNGHRFKTFEVDGSLADTIAKYAARPSRIAGFSRRASLFQRNQSILAKLRSGEKHAVLAEEYGVAHNTITTIANKAGIRRKTR